MQYGEREKEERIKNHPSLLFELTATHTLRHHLQSEHSVSTGTQPHLAHDTKTLLSFSPSLACILSLGLSPFHLN